MRRLFKNYYELGESQWTELWDECVFILDTNVLLNLYRYNKSTSDDLLRVLKAVSDRLWIPHQVALEYQENRRHVEIGQINKYTEVENIISAVRDELQSKLANLKLEERHYSIDPNRLLSKIGTVFSEFSTELEALKQAQPNLLSELQKVIDDLFEGKVGPEPESQENLEEIYKEAKLRYQQKRPPGYMDKEKEKDKSEKLAYFYKGLFFQRQFGDVILWFQIIEFAKANNLKQIILVTDELKEDWWRKIAGRQIGPRLELIDEITSKSEVELFHMYDSARFMAYAKKHFGLDIKQESINQVRDVVNRNISPSTLRRSYKLAENALFNWLQSRYPNDEIFINIPDFPDITRIEHESLARVGYEIKMIRRWDSTQIFEAVTDLKYRGYFELDKGKIDKLVIVIMFDKINFDEEISKVFNFPNIVLPDGITLMYGELVEGGKEGKADYSFTRYSQQLSLFEQTSSVS